MSHEKLLPPLRAGKGWVGASVASDGRVDVAAIHGALAEISWQTLIAR
jgi:hypothetical protein